MSAVTLRVEGCGAEVRDEKKEEMEFKKEMVPEEYQLSSERKK